MKQYAIFEGVEVMYVAGETGATVALDDVARALGYDFATDLDVVIDLLDLRKETLPIRTLPRGVVDMISLAAALKIADAFESRQGPALATFLRTQIPMSEFDRVRYDNLPQNTINLLRARKAVSRLLENHPDASAEFVAERLDVPADKANYLLSFSRNFQLFESGKPEMND